MREDKTVTQFRDIASSPIVKFSGKATMLIKANTTGNLLTYPILLPFDGDETNFRIDYFNELNKLHAQGKLEELLQFNFLHSSGEEEKLLTSQELFDLLNESIETNTKVCTLEEVTKKVPKFYRPVVRFMADKRNTGLFIIILVSVVANIATLINIFIWLFLNT
jgi:hypothetical protein